MSVLYANRLLAELIDIYKGGPKHHSKVMDNTYEQLQARKGSRRIC